MENRDATSIRSSFSSVGLQNYEMLICKHCSVFLCVFFVAMVTLYHHVVPAEFFVTFGWHSVAYRCRSFRLM